MPTCNIELLFPLCSDWKGQCSATTAEDCDGDCIGCSASENNTQHKLEGVLNAYWEDLSTDPDDCGKIRLFTECQWMSGGCFCGWQVESQSDCSKLYYQYNTDCAPPGS